MIKHIYYYFIGLLFAFCFTSCNQDNPPYGNNKKAGKYYKIRGFNMYCETYGSGKPLLMIHGNSGSINTFYGNIPYFADHYKVIVADSRAQGKSIDDRDSLSFEMILGAMPPPRYTPPVAMSLRARFPASAP